MSGTAIFPGRRAFTGPGIALLGGMPVDLVVTFSPVGGGHKGAALALEEAARARGLRTVLLDAFDFAPRWFGDMYLRAHLAGQGLMPTLYGSAYAAANHPRGVLDPLRRGMDELTFAKLRAHVRSLEPRAVVATHHLPLVALAHERRRGRLAAPLGCVVTDFTAHAVWAEAGVDCFFVGGPFAKDELLDHGVPDERVFCTGIPVRGAFERAPARRPPRRGAGRLRVLVTSGGFGVGPLARTVASFADVDDVELVVVCGDAEPLHRRIEGLARRLGLRAEVVGYERDMPRRIAEAHVVVGKAGGLTVTEALTAGRPIVVAGAVPGNETINEVFVCTQEAGVSVRPDNVGPAVLALWAQGRLGAMGQRARASVPRGAADAIVRRLLASSRRAA